MHLCFICHHDGFVNVEMEDQACTAREGLLVNGVGGLQIAPHKVPGLRSKLGEGAPPQLQVLATLPELLLDQPGRYVLLPLHALSLLILATLPELSWVSPLPQ